MGMGARVFDGNRTGVSLGNGMGVFAGGGSGVFLGNGAAVSVAGGGSGVLVGGWETGGSFTVGIEFEVEIGLDVALGAITGALWVFVAPSTGVQPGGMNGVSVCGTSLVADGVTVGGMSAVSSGAENG
jgi:hypothetical protein